MFKKLLLSALIALVPSLALAQATTWPPPGGAFASLGVYNSSAPVMTNGQVGFLQVDSSGRLITAGSGSGGSGAVTIADGDDVAEGLTTATAATAGGVGSVSAKLRLVTTQLGTLATALTTINSTLGSPFQASASIANTTFAATQGTAANLNATVVGTGTFATQAAPTPVTTGGVSVYFVQPTASDNHVVIKAGAGQVYKIMVTNNSATVNYLRLYNATTGFNGCNSATNLQYQVAIPASTTVGGIADSWDLGMAFATGISICVTSGYATTDTTNATATAMSVNIGYK